ncbi:ribonucleoside-diphosphate reductase, alpha subunit [Desulfurobacterium thermolithotrophum DSM 11699]|uniref:Ribonucleoside-diphosphate reductase n=1 Tax=Desulfurobacterium thermolithotrophum (strain DSM 11699 / BSA) TaxID=868864 RepID=F0S1Q8_DESTD|nr:ribonucleoside-diphosphate reductase subunit alpha [Desulfurobacterium thermolithotrophum]ADY72913.1 ribonucleoside-diphosphate reductase, alpha subunit [Desulfurobacterium thermolithotrophum DSM 11699]
MRKISVVKRNGSKEPLNIEKIRKVINWAAKGLEVNTLKLESKLKLHFYDGITTREIHKSIVNTALQLTTPEEPDWRILAGRLFIFNLYKEVSIKRGTSKLAYIGGGKEYLKVLKDLVEKGLYTNEIFKSYSEEEIVKAGDYLKLEYDFLYDYAGANLLAKRYLCIYEDYPIELPQEMYMSIALMLAKDESIDKRMTLVKKFYDLIAGKKLSLATPILINLRRPNGNLSSCFITAMDDSLDSIMYTANQVAQISKRAGGVGVNLSRIRAQGSWIKKVFGASGGVVPWIRILNDIAVAVNQEGKRAGAVTVALDVWHLDIFDFLELKTENGDLRRKAFDIFPQVVIPDLFMERVKKDKDWLLVDPYEVEKKFGFRLYELWGEEFEKAYVQIEKESYKLKLKKKVKAKELLKEILKTQVATGLPYIFFKDTANRLNPLKHDGYIGNGNLCMESFSNFRPSKSFKTTLEKGKIVSKVEKPGLVHTCNLLSINLANIENDKELEDVVRTAVRILDNTIDLTTSPILESKLHNDRYRTIGIGTLGLADYLAKREIPYGKQSLNLIDELYEKIAYYGIDESINLAKERGKFQAFEGSDWSRGIIIGKDREYLLKKTHLKEKWLTVLEKLKKYGIRNGQLFAIAPNTSSGLLQGATPGVLPPFSRFYIDKNQKQAVPICPPYLKKKFWFYRESKFLNQKEVIDVISTIQRWVDSGISMELLFNLNLGVRAKDIFETVIYAWEKGIKTIYYVRTIQKDSQTAISKKEECVACAN